MYIFVKAQTHYLLRNAEYCFIDFADLFYIALFR